MAGPWGRHLQDNLNIDKQFFHNLAHLLYSNVKTSCFGCPSCDLSQDRQLSGLGPSKFELIYPKDNIHASMFKV